MLRGAAATGTAATGAAGTTGTAGTATGTWARAPGASPARRARPRPQAADVFMIPFLTGFIGPKGLLAPRPNAREFHRHAPLLRFFGVRGSGLEGRAEFAAFFGRARGPA